MTPAEPIDVPVASRHIGRGGNGALDVIYHHGLSEIRERVYVDGSVFSRWWLGHKGEAPAPGSVAEALERIGELACPSHIRVEPKGKNNWRITGRRFGAAIADNIFANDHVCAVCARPAAGYGPALGGNAPVVPVCDAPDCMELVRQAGTSLQRAFGREDSRAAQAGGREARDWLFLVTGTLDLSVLSIDQACEFNRRLVAGYRNHLSNSVEDEVEAPGG